MADLETAQAAWIAYLKSKTQLTSLLITSDTPNGADEIRELEWQGDDFHYPNVRVSMNYFPSINGCGPDDLDVFIDVFSEQKSSKQASQIAAVIQSILQKHPFTQDGVKFPMVWVEKVDRPNRDIYAWRVTLHIKGLANDV